MIDDNIGTEKFHFSGVLKGTANLDTDIQVGSTNYVFYTYLDDLKNNLYTTDVNYYTYDERAMKVEKSGKQLKSPPKEKTDLYTMLKK